jgi:RecA-family ATPase
MGSMTTNWLIEGVLSVGVYGLIAAPHVGKSWVVLEMATAIASGRKAFGLFPTNQCSVLILSLTDDLDIVHERLGILERTRPTGRVNISFDCPKFSGTGDGGAGIVRLRRYLEATQDCKAVFIDPLFVPFMQIMHGRRVDACNIVQRLREVAEDYHIAILFTLPTFKTHRRRGSVFDRLMCNNGMNALRHALDGTFILMRNHDRVMHFESRHASHPPLVLSWGDDDIALAKTGR